MVDHCNQENKLNEKLLQLSNNTMETRDSDYGSLNQGYQRPSLREMTTREFYQQDNGLITYVKPYSKSRRETQP